MSLKEQIDSDIKQAMLNKQKDELRALRAIKSLILLAETEKGKQGELMQDVEMGILMKAAKQRKDSIQIYEDQDRQDLVQKEKQGLPEETEMLGGILSGAASPLAWKEKEAPFDFYDLKGVVEGLLDALNIDAAAFTALRR